MSGLRGALAFLTRLPVGAGTARINPAATAPLVPVVGALMGLLVAGTYIGLATALPQLPAAAVAISIGILATGALHEDGLADTADAWGANDRDHALRILRDPTHGTYGVLALLGSFTIRVTALASLDRNVALAVLPAVHALSRTAAIAVIAAGPPLTRDGLGAGYGPAARGRPLAIATAVTLLAAAGLLGRQSPGWIALTLAIAALSRQLAKRRLGGVNGDIAGAAEQLVEAALLLTAVRWQPQPLFAR